MDRILDLLCRRPALALLALVVLTLAAGLQLFDPRSGEPRLGIDPSTNRLLPEGDPEKIYYDFVRKLFGSDETMLVALTAEDVFRPDHLRRVRRMTERIEALPEVHHVVSITNARNVRGTEDGLDVRPFVSEIPEDPQALAAIKREALENPIYAGNLVSADARTTALMVYFLNFSDAEFIERGIDRRIAAIAEEEANGASVHLAGGPHVKVAEYEYLRADLLRALPIILALGTVILAISFRTARGVAIPLLTVAVSLLWTLAFAHFWGGGSLNRVTVLIPALFVVLPLTYCVHVVAEYYDSLRHEPDASHAEAIHRALREVSLPVLLTGLTTAAGFAAMTLSSIGAIRDFGVISVAGILASVLASLSVPPTVFGVLGKPRRVPAETPERTGFARFAQRFAAFDLANRPVIYAAALAFTALAALAALEIEVGVESIDRFPSGSSVRRDFEAVNAGLEGANVFNVVVEADERGALQEPRHLRQLEDLQGWLEDQPEIGGTTSMVDYLKLLHRAFFADDPAHFSIPHSRRLVSTLLFFGATDELEGFVDSTHRYANVVVRANVIDSQRVSELVERIETRLESLPSSLQARVTGNPIIVSRLFDDIVSGLTRSVLAAFALIYLILLVMWVDPGTAAKALIPNALPVAFYFGALGLSGIPLSFATSLIAPMALGIAIDDTIHYFSRFNVQAKRLADESRATALALRTVGRPVTITTAILCLGFAVLVGSDLLSYVQFGALAAATLAFAWVVDFTLTPALCAGLRIVTLWDTLTLDLGEDPQGTIPAFEGLRNFECRIIAQMASLRAAPAGAPLMRIGEPSKDMYVVISGLLQAWVPRGEGRTELNEHPRGDVTGEVSMFLATGRTANVDVVEDARLLRITPKSLERLRRRHPRIATKLLRNLNMIQADRLSKTTELVR